jgi:hypothetical protein
MYIILQVAQKSSEGESWTATERTRRQSPLHCLVVLQKCGYYLRHVSLSLHMSSGNNSRIVEHFSWPAILDTMNFVLKSWKNKDFQEKPINSTQRIKATTPVTSNRTRTRVRNLPEGIKQDNMCSLSPVSAKCGSYSAETHKLLRPYKRHFKLTHIKPDP